jgi:23S rRNA (cytosine1962-C5)-methyltransferase
MTNGVTMIAIRELALSVSRQDLRGIPWIFSNQVRHLDDADLNEVRAALVRIAELGRVGIYSKASLISVRLLPESFAKDVQGRTEITEENLTEICAKHLIKMRQQKESVFPFVPSEAFRWLHGDADGTPGIVADDYGDFVTLQSSSSAGEFLLPFIIDALLGLDNRPLLERSSGQTRKMEGLPERTRWIRSKVDEVCANVARLKLRFEPLRAQKTGLFLDQRNNLEFLSQYCLQRKTKISSMLDICSYAGAWSSAGALGGISHFTLIDADSQALKQASINIKENSGATGIQPSGVTIEPRHGDLFEEISKLRNENRTFDIVVADPPAFAKTKKHLHEATLAYSRLAKNAARLVSEDGLLVLCSCSKHMDAETFWTTATRALGASWILIHRGGQSPDHTISTTPASSEYLKCLFFQKRNSV